jgi:hypothetical protein
MTKFRQDPVSSALEEQEILSSAASPTFAVAIVTAGPESAGRTGHLMRLSKGRARRISRTTPR